MTAALKLDLSPRAFGGALLALVVVIAGAGWFAVVSPKRSEASKLDSAIQAKQTQLAAEAHPTTTSSGPASVPAGALIKALPDAPGMPDIVDQLNSLAVRAGVTLDTVTPSAAVAATGYESIPLNVVVDGQYFGVEKFLQLVRNQVQVGKHDHLLAAGRLFDVQVVQLQQTEPAPTVTATLTLDAFYYAPAAVAPTASSTTDTTTSDSTTTTSAG